MMTSKFANHFIMDKIIYAINVVDIVDDYL